MLLLPEEGHMQRVYYDSQKEYLSFWRRLFLVVTVVGAAACCWSDLRFLLQAFEFRAWLIPLPTVFTLLYCFGLELAYVLLLALVGYCIINTKALFVGYRPRKKGQWVQLAPILLQLPERTSVAIVEVPQKPERETGETPREGYPSNLKQYREQASPLKQGQGIPAKSPAILRIVFSFFSHCVIRVKDKVSGVSRELFLTIRQRAMLAYIAWNAKKAPIFTEEVRKHFYFGLTNNSLDRDKSDVKDEAQSVVEGFGEVEEVIVLLKPSRGKGSRNKMVLSEQCDLDIPHQMMFWHEQAEKKLLPQTADPIPLSQFRILYKQVITEYGRGLFEEDLSKALSSNNIYWDWAISDFKKHRMAQISCLDYCIKREEAESEQMSDPYRWEECLQQAAWLCKTASFTCATFDPELRQGERFLQRYLQLCKRLLKHDEARETYEEYEQQLQRYEVSWEPSSETRYLMKQVKGS
jgi:hypothetical protein